MRKWLPSGRVARTPSFVALLLGLMAPDPVFARALPAWAAVSPADANAVVHATRGVVKALNATTLVVSRRRKRGDITFTLGRGVHVEGIIELGATVSVRYRDEGSDHVALAISTHNRSD